MANFLPKIATNAQASGNQNIAAGQFIIATDTGDMYFDVSASSRIKLGGASSGGVQKYATTIGNGSATSFNITHNLNTNDVIVMGYLVGNNQSIWLEYTITNANTVNIVFDSAPASNSVRIVVMG